MYATHDFRTATPQCALHRFALGTFSSALLLAPAAYAQNTQNAADTLAAPTRLQEIVVTAAGFEQAVEDAPASITVVPRAELEKKAYRDVTDALRDVPGVVVTGGGSSSDISLRGMAAGYTMLLVDGRRQNSRETRPNSDGPGIEQGWLPPLEAIERIEVVRGPMSSLYGSDAMGGVINIITRKVPAAWGGSVTLDTTRQERSHSGDMWQGKFFVGGPIKDGVLGLQVYGHKSHRAEDKFLNGFNQQATRSGTVKLSLKPHAKHDLVAEASRTLQKRASHPGKSMAIESCRGARCTPNSNSVSEYDKTLYSLTHTGDWGFGTSSSYIQREAIDNPGRKMYLTNTEVNSQLSLPLGERHLSTLGAAYKKEHLRDQGNQMPGPSPSGTLERYQWALYGENEWSMTDSFALTTGLRMNKDENYGTHWTPRLYGVWKATDTLSLKGGVSTGFKAPSLRAASSDWGQITGGGGDPAVILGNPNLKPEKSVSQEIGVVWNNRVNLDASLTLFNTDFKDKITEQRSCVDTASGGRSIVTGNCVVNGKAFKFISDRINVDKANMRGVESTLTWHFTDTLRLAANYTFTRSEQKSGANKGKPLNQMPRHMVNATLDWQANEALGTWVRMNFRGKTSDYLSRTAMREGTPSFTFVDMGLNYKLAKHVKLGLGVYNVLDKQVDNANFGAVYDGRRYWLSMTAGF